MRQMEGDTFQPIVFSVEYVETVDQPHLSRLREQKEQQLLYWLYDLLESERKYKKRLVKAVDVLEALKLCDKHCPELLIVRNSLRSIILTSNNFVRQIELLLSHWRACVRRRRALNTLELATLFDSELWSHYERYHAVLSSRIRRLFKRERPLNTVFRALLHHFKFKTGTSLEIILILPEERVLAYHNQLKNFCRSHSTETPRKLVETVARLEETEAIETRVEQIVALNNEIRSQLDYGTDSDDINLASLSPELQEKMKFHQRRTKSCSGFVGLGANWYDSDSVNDMSARYQNQRHADEKFVRTYIKESRVHLATGLQSQERYLFLFSDLLLIAKEKGVSSYKLKEKIRVREIWLRSGGVEEVAECVHSSDKSFVIGWPTVNFVAEFGSVQERNEWYELLEKTLEYEKDRERPKVTTVNVHYKSLKSAEVRRITLNNYQTARDLLRLSLLEYDLSEDLSHQLWVHSAKENAPYPLYGHECPFAILMSHVRDYLPDEGQQLSLRELEDLASHAVSHKCRFVLRPRSYSAAPSTRKTRLRRAAPGHLYSQIKKKLVKSDSGDSAGSGSPSGLLFGHSLNALSDDNSVPKPVMNLLNHIFVEGVFVEGIFRKPPKQSTVRQLRELLDAGEEVNLSDYYPLVAASTLKEFLRNLPNKLLINDMYFEWVAVCDEPDKAKQLLLVRRLLSQLPPANYQLLRHLLCVLHQVAVHRPTNQMTSQSLSVCIGPSLLERPPGRPHGVDLQDSVRRIPQLTQLLIDHVQDLFGSDTLHLFGAPPQQKTTLSCVKQDSTEDDSESIGRQRQDTSSLDSLAASSSSPSSSRPHSSSMISHPANVSRDSGLSEAHYLTDDSLQQSLATKRTFSTGDNALPQVAVVASTKSVENLTECDQLPDLFAGRQRAISTLDRRGTSGLMTQSWHANTLEGENDHKRDGNRGKHSPDSLYESQESEGPFPSPGLGPLRCSKHLELGTLHRSESGEHLVLSESSEKSLSPSALSLPVSRDNTKSPTVCATSGLLDEKSPGPAYMSRESLFRRPARLRKGLHGQSSNSPEPPEFDESGDVELNDESPGRLVIRCNAKDSPPPTVVDSGFAPHPVLSKSLHSEASSSGASSLSSLASSDSDSHMFTTSTPAYRDRPLPPTLRPMLNAVGRMRSEPADSSTVTEASSDDDTTPVVSRETSRAKEYQAKVREMFAPTPSVSTVTVSPLQKADYVKRPYASGSLLSSRPQYSWQTKSQPAAIVSSFSPVRQQSAVSKPIAAVPAIVRSPSAHITPTYCLADKSPEMEKPQLPSYEETMRRRSLRGEETAVEILTARDRISNELYRKAPLERTSNLDSGFPSQKTGVPVRDRHRRYNGRREDRPRRKTLGGEEFRELSDLHAQRQQELNASTPSRMASCDKLHAQSHSEPKRSEISWSVNQLRSMFDDHTDGTAQNIRQRLGGKDEMPSTYKSASALSSVRLSDSQANYPVVKPPPLQAYSEFHLPLRLASTSGPCSARTPTSPSKPGLVRALASTFESAIGAKGAGESYV